MSEKQTIEILPGITAEKEGYKSVMILIDIRGYDDWIKKGNHIIGFELDVSDMKKLKRLAKEK